MTDNEIVALIVALIVAHRELLTNYTHIGYMGCDCRTAVCLRKAETDYPELMRRAHAILYQHRKRGRPKTVAKDA